MLFTITITNVSNGYLVAFSDPNCVLFREGRQETFFGSWDKIAPFIEHTLTTFKKKARG